MAGSGAIKAGAAYVEIFGEDSKLQRTLGSVSRKLGGWSKKVSAIGKAVSAAGVAVLSPLLAAAAAFDSMGSNMADMSGRTGASVEALSSFAFAAEQTGTSTEDVETGLKKMQKAVYEAATGSKEAQQALANLGLAAEDLTRLAPEEQFRLIASRMAEIQNPTERAAVAMQLFGKSGTSLLPMIADLKKLEDRARELGIVMSKEDADAADRLGDAWGELKAVGKALVFQVGAALAPMLTELVTKAAETGAAFIQWARDNRDLILTVAKIAGIVAAVGAALLGLSAIVSAGAAVFGGLATVVGIVWGALGMVASVFAFLASGPIGWAAVAVAGFATALLTMTDLGSQALAFISEAFANFSADAIKAWQGIRNALGNGDIGQAMVVAGAFLTLQWAKICDFMTVRWINWKADMTILAIECASEIAGAFITAFAVIAKNWNAVLAGMRQAALIHAAAVTLILAGADAKTAAQAGAGIKFTVGVGQRMDDAKIDDAANAVKRGLPVAAAGLKAGVDIKRDQDLKGLPDNVAIARMKFDDAVAAAGRPPTKLELKERHPEIPDFEGSMEKAKTSVSGTFSAAAAQGLAGASQLDKLLTENEEQTRTLKKIAAKPVGMGVF